MSSLLPVIYAHSSHVFAIALVGVCFCGVIEIARVIRRRLYTTPLKGPRSPGWIFGLDKILRASHDSSHQYEQWAQEFGVIYKVPSALGMSRVVLCDPKAIAHYYARETWTYVRTPLSKIATARLAGKGLLWSDGESHRRQRKALSPAFSNAAMRAVTSAFYDSAYKATAAWNSLLESSETPNGILIDIQIWMNRISLDSIGIAGFSHDFGTLDNRPCAVADVFQSLAETKPSKYTSAIFMLGQAFPFLLHLPNSRLDQVSRLHESVGNISMTLLERTRREKAMVENGNVDKSILGLLIKAESEDTEIHISAEEVMAQMKLLIIAGYETTSISMTWALIELSRNEKAQSKLRAELSRFAGTDPTWDQLTNELPYLDAVVHEILRLHPPVVELTRLARLDDFIPLSEPVQTANGQWVDHISVARGTHVTIPIRCVNRSEYLWGPDAKDFVPDRWLNENGISGKAKEIQGHRHLLTFADGPRMCLGKNFALAEFKATLSVLIRNFTFELRDGPDTELEIVRFLLPRPRVVGEEGSGVPLRVRRIEL